MNTDAYYYSVLTIDNLILMMEFKKFGLNLKNLFKPFKKFLQYNFLILP
jgi:hypothetical protein